MKSVYCAVRTGSLNKAVCASYLMQTVRDGDTAGFILCGTVLRTVFSVGICVVYTDVGVSGTPRSNDIHRMNNIQCSVIFRLQQETRVQ